MPDKRAGTLGVDRNFRGEALGRMPDLSEFQAERLIDFFMSQMGPPVYNQAVQDARRYVMAKLDDLDGEVYEPEDCVTPAGGPGRPA